jgi:hypothetical protein
MSIGPPDVFDANHEHVVSSVFSILGLKVLYCPGNKGRMSFLPAVLIKGHIDVYHCPICGLDVCSYGPGQLIYHQTRETLFLRSPHGDWVDLGSH